MKTAMTKRHVSIQLSRPHSSDSSFSISFAPSEHRLVNEWPRSLGRLSLYLQVRSFLF